MIDDVIKIAAALIPFLGVFGLVMRGGAFTWKEAKFELRGVFPSRDEEDRDPFLFEVQALDATFTPGPRELKREKKKWTARLERLKKCRRDRMRVIFVGDSVQSPEYIDMWRCLMQAAYGNCRLQITLPKISTYDYFTGSLLERRYVLQSKYFEEKGEPLETIEIFRSEKRDGSLVVYPERDRNWEKFKQDRIPIP